LNKEGLRGVRRPSLTKHSNRRSAEEAMTPGPSTVRLSIGSEALLGWIRRRKLTSFLLTTPDGRLVRREDLE
jgi:hypothetical protein